MVIPTALLIVVLARHWIGVTRFGVQHASCVRALVTLWALFKIGSHLADDCAASQFIAGAIICHPCNGWKRLPLCWVFPWLSCFHSPPICVPINRWLYKPCCQVCLNRIGDWFWSWCKPIAPDWKKNKLTFSNLDLLGRTTVWKKLFASHLGGALKKFCNDNQIQSCRTQKY